jgi:hypothetical protein
MPAIDGGKGSAGNDQRLAPKSAWCAKCSCSSEALFWQWRVASGQAEQEGAQVFGVWRSNKKACSADRRSTSGVAISGPGGPRPPT